MKLKLKVLTPNFPTKKRVYSGAFVGNLVKDWVDSGMDVEVINPQSYADIFRSIFKKSVPIQDPCKVRRPRYLSISNKTLLGINLNDVTLINLSNSVLGSGSYHKDQVLYAKFLMKSGLPAYNLHLKYGCKYFLDLGESNLISTIQPSNMDLAKNIIRNASGIICVSPRLVEDAITLGADPDSILLIPNQANSQFKPLSKEECRIQLGLPVDSFIVSFVGHFIYRKGPLRVLEAIKHLDQVYGVFIGEGDQKPEGERVLFSQTVENSDLPLWLNASDVFVLPTLAEGSCNAIEEALACGVPVVTSDIADVRWQVDSGKGLLVDPLDTRSIANAIQLIKDGKFELAKVIPADSSSPRRAEVIAKWIEKRAF
ncbi:MAG: glycosyltransferase [Idiomarina sp.]|nr:glycosyltransferase [Idiomarina sp.]